MVVDRCSWKRCRARATIGYLKRKMCDRHWARFCRLCDAGRLTEARMKIGLKPRRNASGSRQEDHADRAVVGVAESVADVDPRG